MMIKYNIQDTALTEEIYFKVRPYLSGVMHQGVLQGASKMTCPHCGGDHGKLYRTIVTEGGSIQRVMKCKKDGVKYKVSNAEYLKSL